MKIAIGGLNKPEMEKTMLSCGYPNLQVLPMTDMEAVVNLKKKEVDYYFGVCHSGGGAIAMMIGASGITKLVQWRRAAEKRQVWIKSENGFRKGNLFSASLRILLPRRFLTFFNVYTNLYQKNTDLFVQHHLLF